jgi:transcriptional regulator with XRE-family HTH domain
MTSDPYPEPLLDEIVGNYLRYLEGQAPEPDLSILPIELQSEATSRIALLTAAWGALNESGPSLDADPVARRFGFDRAQETIVVNGGTVRRLRQLHHLELEAMTDALNVAGADTTVGAMFRVERASAVPVNLSVASALAAVLDCSVADLEAVDNEATTPAQAFIDSADFQEIIADWAITHQQDAARVRRAAEEALLSTAHRAEDVTTHHWREILRAILRSMK